MSSLALFSVERPLFDKIDLKVNKLSALICKKVTANPSIMYSYCKRCEPSLGDQFQRDRTAKRIMMSGLKG